ncbi:MAG: EndoU domain-containing protein [Flavipsychrobacter sp.]|nr:EndoU domain-containing protein [Flavipsychrobacter sp.]
MHDKEYFYVVPSLLEPRLSVFRHLSRRAEMQMYLCVLPPSVYWINTMGASASLVKNTGLVQRASLQLFPSGAIPQEMPYLEGPFLSMEHVEQCSVAYHLIIRPNAFKATHILLHRVKRKFPDAIHGFSETFIQHLPYILEHTFIGNIRRGGLTGVHYKTSDVRTKGYIRSSVKSPTPFSLIEKVNPLSGEVLTKRQPSTFWPSEWGIERCVVECAIAWNNRECSNSPDVEVGYTSTGLKVKFCFRGGVLKTVYPDESNNYELFES